MVRPHAGAAALNTNHIRRVYGFFNPDLAIGQRIRRSLAQNALVFVHSLFSTMGPCAGESPDKQVRVADKASFELI